MTNHSALLIIDVQKAFDCPSWGVRNNPDAESKMAQLLDEWRNRNWPVIHIRHCSLEPNSPLRSGLPGNEFKKVVQPISGEKEFSKTVNSAFIGTGLQSYLHAEAISSLVIVGLTTDHCVSTTTRMAGNLGYQVTLVCDATATYERVGHDGVTYSAEEMHRVNLASLNGEFCIVKSTEEVLSDN